MTTNQTIDGVSRRLLVEAMWALDNAGIFSTATALRALLDAPACKTCCDQGEIFVSKGKVESHMLTEPDPIYRGCPDCKPAAQPQGDPVAWQRKSKNEDGRWFALPDSDVEEAVRLGYEVRKLYAEQPAPVAVVMPERSNAVASANVSAKQAYALGWNACLDEVTRLNKAKD